ncbi:hypothetical protein BFJ68_g16635 [Fusarium oxysporum]|uniref:Uncharacterized protein n=1 Tax=Fusarium oxysporum TaxID=5507 RepID=A0A420PB59_FUSOX|nr:hypothetical protein BFJ68_g16635 [Fusarium oxysporum]
MPSTTSTELPSWVADIHKATNAETRSQPWKALLQESFNRAEANGDRCDVHREPTATQHAPGRVSKFQACNDLARSTVSHLTMNPNDELVRLNYALRDPIHDLEKPYQIISDIPGMKRRSNVEIIPGSKPELIQDLRGKEHLFGLDSHGFQILEHHSAVKDWSDKQAIEKTYLFEAEQLIANYLDDVDEVYIFNWRVNLTPGPI